MTKRTHRPLALAALAALGALALASACDETTVAPDGKTPPPADPGPSTQQGAPLAKPTGCDAAPGWLALPSCMHEGAVYAKGAVSGVANPALAATTAMNRARAELTKLGLGTSKGDGAVELRGSEILDTFTCGGSTYALARLRPGEALTSPLPPCDATALSAPATATTECPEWTRKGAWREGDTIIAVGAASGLANAAMAANVARNRAAAEAQRLIDVTLKVTDTGVTAEAGGNAALLPIDAEMVMCGGAQFAKVSMKAP